MIIKCDEKTAIRIILVLLATSITVGFFNIWILYLFLAFELGIISIFFARKLTRKISLLHLSWIVSTFYIILNTKTFDYYLFFYLLNCLLGLMILISISESSSEYVYEHFKAFVLFGFFSGLSVFIELLSPSIIFSIYQRFAPSDLADIQTFLRNGRYLGITNYVWYTSMLLFLGGGFILSEFKNYKRSQKVMSILVLAVLFGASFMSGSRSSMIVFPLVVILFYGGKKAIKNVTLTIVVFLVFYFFIMYTNLSLRIIDKLRALITSVQNGAVIDDTRKQLRELALDDFKAHWLFGIGWYEFRFHSNEYFNRYLHTHNLYLQLIAENGIFGTFIIVIPWILTYLKSIVFLIKYRIHSNQKKYRSVLFFVMILTLLYIDSIVHVTLFDPRTMLIFYIISGVLIQMTKKAPELSSTANNQMIET